MIASAQAGHPACRNGHRETDRCRPGRTRQPDRQLQALPALVPTTTQDFPPCARDAVSPRSRITSCVTALAVGDNPASLDPSPTRRDNGTRWLQSGIAASPTAVADTRLRSGTVGHNNMRLDFNAAFRGHKQSGSGSEGLLPYLESETLLLDEASRSHCHCATGS